MEPYNGSKLENFVKKSLEGITEKRDIFGQLDNYVMGKNDRKTMCLYGLRRTGKTIMMLQEIQDINDYNKVLYLYCENTRNYKDKDTKELVEESDTVYDIKKMVASYPDCKYIFIDEITKVVDFIQAGSVLSDLFATEGKKVVITGTDSLGLLLAGKDELYDRLRFLHTTYIPFKEYNRILGKDLMDYIQYGGTLSPENTFYNNDSLNEYSNSAIVNNIVNSLRKAMNPYKELTALEKMIEHNDLQSAIEKVLEFPSKDFVESIINTQFKSHDIGSLKQLMYSKDIADRGEILSNPDINEQIRAFLNIKSNPFISIEKDTVFDLIKILKAIDVLYQIPRKSYLRAPDNEEYVFIQPGMRYGQAESIAEALMSSEVFYNYSADDRNQILDLLKSDICGNLLEEIIFYQLSIEFKVDNPSAEYSITKYKNALGDEADILVLNHSTKSILEIEVKLSQTQHPKQLKHLSNNEFTEEIEKRSGMKVLNPIVVYRGPTCTFEGYVYIKAEDFLNNARSLCTLLTTSRITDISQILSLINPADNSFKPNLPKIQNPKQKTDIDPIGLE